MVHVATTIGVAKGRESTMSDLRQRTCFDRHSLEAAVVSWVGLDGTYTAVEPQTQASENHHLYLPLDGMPSRKSYVELQGTRQNCSGDAVILSRVDESHALSSAKRMPPASPDHDEWIDWCDA